MARRLSRMGYSLETPSWAQVADHFLRSNLDLARNLIESVPWIGQWHTPE
jgi:hypothetical protein